VAREDSNLQPDRYETRVKFLSRLLTALNLLPSTATLAFVSRPSSRQSAPNCAHTLRIAGPLSLRGNRLVIGDQPARQPHRLHVAPSLALEPAARLDPIEIAVDVELQQYRRMIRRPAGYLGIDPAEPKLRQIQFLDKDIDHTNRIVLANPVFQAFRKKRPLPTIRALNEAPHLIPPQIAQESYRENQIPRRVFTQPGSKAAPMPMSALGPI
jgi:hypothetical protein